MLTQEGLASEGGQGRREGELRTNQYAVAQCQRRVLGQRSTDGREKWKEHRKSQRKDIREGREEKNQTTWNNFDPIEATQKRRRRRSIYKL